MKCPNCGTKLKCGCSIRRAYNGTKVCTNCKKKYETALRQKK